jgi:hypothetical protein
MKLLTQQLLTNKENDMEKFEDLKGKTLSAIVGGSGDEEMLFVCNDGNKYILFYEHDCCASCVVVDIAGDLQDLIGHPLLLAEEVTNKNKNPPGVKVPECQDSFTWTFYKLATIKGYVTISWYGESNGYYNENVSFRTLEAT